MDRSELLEVASQYLDRVVILLTVAGEDRLALDIEKWMDCVEFSSASSEPKRPRVTPLTAIASRRRVKRAVS